MTESGLRRVAEERSFAALRMTDGLSLGGKRRGLGSPRAAWFVRLTLLTLFATSVCLAGTLSGTVINRSTGKPEANVDLDLLSPTAGMAELATAKSDAQGRFSVTKDAIGTAPVLIRATFHDVGFNTFAPPGRPEVEVEVYDISKDPKGMSVPSHVVIFEPKDNTLVGAEEYTVQNDSKPPGAYFRTEGNFDFAIPEHATLDQVSTATTMGMPINQASIDKGKGRYAIAYAFRPGPTNVRLSYELPYANSGTTVKLPATYAGAKLLVVVPPGITATGNGLVPAGQEQGMLVFTHQPLAAKGTLEVSLSGVATALPGGEEQGQAGQEGNSRTGPEVIAAPSRLDEFKWYLFAGLAAIFAMGALLLSKKQVVVAAGGDAAVASGAKVAKAAGTAGKSKKTAGGTTATAANPNGAKNVSNAAAEVQQHVATSMDSLKEQIFRLELRRQAGTISEEEYGREKARFDKMLRDILEVGS